MFYNFLHENGAVYKVMWKSTIKPESMRFACWISKATDTHLSYVSPIGFPWQQWLCELASVVHYTSKLFVLLFLIPVIFQLSVAILQT
jgi:hypothetical protein